MCVYMCVKLSLLSLTLCVILLTNCIVLSAADKNTVLSDPFTMFKSISAEPFIKHCLQNPFGPGVQVQSLQFMCFRVFYHWKFVKDIFTRGQKSV